MEIQPEIKSKVNNLIGKGKLEEALEFLIQSVSNDHHIKSQLLELQQNLNSAESKGFDGSYTSEMVKRERTLTTKGLLNLLHSSNLPAQGENGNALESVESLKAQLAEAKKGEQKSTRVAGLYFIVILAAVLSYIFFKFIKG